MSIRGNGNSSGDTFSVLPQPPPLAARLPPVVATGSSAGGLHALMVLLAELPASFPAAVVVVQHIDPRHPSMMARLLGKRTDMKVGEARDGEAIAAGNVYVAPPNHHLLISARGDRLALTSTPRVQYVRPSADVLFESLAEALGARAAAVVLTGTGRDGARGVVAVHARGGRVVVQDEATSDFFGMPGAALGSADIVLPIERIGAELARWAAEVTRR